MPNGTPAAYVVTAILMGVLVGGMLTAFTWACDKWDSYTQEPNEDISAANAKYDPEVDDHPGDDLPQPARYRDEYPKTARGANRAGDRAVATTEGHHWHGQ
jgi:hypothetical protein